MEFSHLIQLCSELVPNSEIKYVRGDNTCTFVRIDANSHRLFAKTPEGQDISFGESFLQEFSQKIIENQPFNTSQLLNNKGSNRAVVDSIIANTSEIYWLQEGRARYTVWIPSHPHKPGELVEWKDFDFLDAHKVQNSVANIWKIKQRASFGINRDSKYRPYITAIKSKPFLLLAGISGTGKSRIVRELARACWEQESEEYGNQRPRNFEMVQVKPNWHDSSELIGYVSRVTGKAEFVAGDFLKFVAKAWEEPDVPYFLCLDEMNLAPVEQYFAEYLSVVESRRRGSSGNVETDPILKKADEEWYFNLTASLTSDETIRQQFNEKGICLPANLIVVGTVNMDETTFSFSRKVLDRAMTIEMNEVDLYGGLTGRHEPIGKIGKAELVGEAVEGVDVYLDNKEVCDRVIDYLVRLNRELEGTPFKVAYRTRNEFLLYTVNNLPYAKDKDGNDLPQGYVMARALDEITSMKILSRIEGDDTKVTDKFLANLMKAIEEGLKEIAGEMTLETSVSLAKLREMKQRLAAGYTSFWS